MITALYICSIGGSIRVGGQKYPTHPDPDRDAARKKHPGNKVVKQTSKWKVLGTPTMFNKSGDEKERASICVRRSL